MRQIIEQSTSDSKEAQCRETLSVGLGEDVVGREYIDKMVCLMSQCPATLRRILSVRCILIARRHMRYATGLIRESPYVELVLVGTNMC